MIVFVDLDETLIHTIVLESNDIVAIQSLANDGYFVQFFTKPHLTRIRPFAHEFLRELVKQHSVYLFTNGNDFYANAILEHFNLKQYFKKIYAKQSSHLIVEDFGTDFDFKLVDDAIYGSETYRIKSEIMKQDIGDRLISIKPYNCEHGDFQLLTVLSKIS